ncbi:MAG: ABC transporter substrate-binding protein [Stellaceae bacterium]
MRRRDFVRIATGAAAWPAVARAGRPYRLAYLALLPGEDATLMKFLSERLRELGYSTEVGLIIEYRSAEGHPERLPELASELVASHPDVLIAGFGTLPAKAAKAATATIPIVFTTVGDPVGARLVGSLGRPGGNVTGLTDQAADIGGKRLELLHEAVPAGTSFAVLMNPDNPYSALALKEIQDSAGSSVTIRVLEARTPDEVLRRFADVENAGIAGLLVVGGSADDRHAGPDSRSRPAASVAVDLSVQGVRASRRLDVLRAGSPTHLRPRRRVCRQGAERR